MPRTIWVFTDPYYPDEVAGGYILTRIAEGLVDVAPVRVLCSQPNYRARGVRAPKREVHNGVRIERCWSTTLSTHKLAFRLLNILTLCASILVKGVLKVRRGDVIIACTTPPLLPVVTAVVRALRGVKCVLIVHDVSPEVLVATDMLRPDSLRYRVMEKVSKRLYSGFDRIVAIGRDMHDLVLAKSARLRDRLVVIPNWADLDIVRPGDRATNALLREQGLAGKFVVLYVGNMGRTHGLEAIVEVARGLRGRTPAHFLFIGTGAKKKWLEETVAAEELGNVTVLGNRPRSDQSNFLNAGDVTIISFISGMAGISVPSRMYNLMAAGRPIIAVADPESELARVVTEERIGWVVPPEQPERLREAVLHAMENPDELREMGRRARAVVEEKYSLEHILQKYVKLIREMDAPALARGVAPDRLPSHT